MLLVHIVSFNHRETILACARSVLKSEGWSFGEDLQLVITDNNSSDGSAELVRHELAEHLGSGLEVISSKDNTGFTGAHNRALDLFERFSADQLFLLNPDLALDPACLRKLSLALQKDGSAGIACPRLLRANDNLLPVTPLRLDSTGIFFTRNFRHFDRGSGELAEGRYTSSEYLAGASGAALMIHRRCLEDVSIEIADSSYFFNPDYFAYREDAELALRTQALGWKCRYQSDAIGYHVRRVTPEKRNSLPDSINRMSVRNRFLMQTSQLAWGFPAGIIPQTLFRNLLVLAGVLLKERSSLTGVREAIALAPGQWAWGRQVAERKRVNHRSIARLFSSEPYSEPALGYAGPGEPVTTLDAVVINFRSGELLRNCLRTSVDSGIRRLFIVNNSAEEDDEVRQSVERVKNETKETLPEMVMLTPGKNLGFAAAVNLVAGKSAADALWILNPDVELSPGVGTRLAERFAEHGDLAAVSPILCADRKLSEPQIGFSARRLPSTGSIIAELLFLHRLWPQNPWTSSMSMESDLLVREFFKDEHPDNGPQLPDLLCLQQPPAACLLIRKTALTEVSGFDTRFWPAWFEDVDFAARLGSAGWRLAIDRAERVYHKGGYSKDSIPDEQFLAIWHKNLQRYVEKHGSSREKFTFSMIYPLAMIFRTICYSLAAMFKAEMYAPARAYFRETLRWLGLRESDSDSIENA